MTIKLQQLIPMPLKEKTLTRQSDIWNKNIQLERGGWIKVKAPSGTGKTTLVHTIYKLREDYSGTVYYDSNELRTIPANTLSQYRQQKISVIFQDMRLFGNLTARENVELKRVMTVPLYEPKVIDDMAVRLGVGHVLPQMASTCSYGEQQRIAIIRALVQPFEWLIMDEPFSHLDKANTMKAAALIAEECDKRNAGFLLLDLDEDEHFRYSQKMVL